MIIAILLKEVETEDHAFENNFDDNFNELGEEAMVKYCSHCGAGVPKGSLMCSSCGCKLD